MPSTANIAIATGILCALGGYFLGQASSIGLFSSKSPTTKPMKRSWPNSYDVNIHPDSSDEDLMKSLDPSSAKKDAHTLSTKSSPDSGSESEEDDGPHGDLNSFSSPSFAVEPHKLVLILRTDLGMTKGKMAAQASHATLACYTSLLYAFPSATSPLPSSMSNLPPILSRWLSSGQPKIALQCSSEEVIHELQAKAVSVGLCARVIRDAGRTQVEPGSVTCLGVGPGPRGVVDEVTGGLKLL